MTAPMKLNEIKQLNEFFTRADKDKIVELLNPLRIDNYNIKDDGSVNAIGEVNLDGYTEFDEEVFLIKWNRILGDFSCNSNDLNSLDFAPVSCNTFGACENRLTTFSDIPIAHTLQLEDNQISSFSGMKKNTYSTIWMYHNPIDTLIGVHEYLSFKSSGELFMNFSKIKSGGIGLILVENFISISDCQIGFLEHPLPKPFHIIKKYLGRPNDIFECQAELIEAGYEEFAKL